MTYRQVMTLSLLCGLLIVRVLVPSSDCCGAGANRACCYS
jgi:hypothetical protein